jgi:hypothetical protein
LATLPLADSAASLVGDEVASRFVDERVTEAESFPPWDNLAPSPCAVFTKEASDVVVPLFSALLARDSFCSLDRVAEDSRGGSGATIGVNIGRRGRVNVGHRSRL